ncbi:MAG: regulatory iron-sulfur-containing complex subunit RicT [Nitrospirota bacterium]|jgi:cell fate regulator YaaT (PSP1 superfamily)
MADVVTVAMRNKTDAVECESGNVSLKLHDRVVVQGEHGLAWGRVVRPPRPTGDDGPPATRGRVVRRMTDDDERAVDHLKVLNAQAFLYARRRIAERGMAMRLLKVEYRFDAKQATFYYSAEQRVDFRDLVRELAYQFRIRVEMRQVSHREGPQVLDGVGPCGRQLCCSGHIRKFDQVSVKMAKAQGLSLNPSKLAGCCGKLKCCLRYEYDGYVEFNKGLPRCGAEVQCPTGVGKVVKHQYVQRLTLVRMAGGEMVEIPVEELQRAATRPAAREGRPARGPRSAGAPTRDTTATGESPPVVAVEGAAPAADGDASPTPIKRRRRRRRRRKGGPGSEGP